LETLRANHPELAISYSNIGEVYCKVDDLVNALTFHKKAADIRLKSLESSHPDFDTCYNNTGLVYFKMDDCLKAQSYYDKALEIRQKCFLNIILI
jgi:tetratricopeptide (TPR) repeat protein